MTELTPGAWAVLFGLGAFHGVNPAMGWLFAVARGLQEKSARAVWGALGPLAAGHFLAVAAAVGAAIAFGAFVPARLLRWPVAALLIGLGIRRLVRHRHPRYRGMRVGGWQLTVWSFLMATIHGAGLMVMPLFLGRPEGLAAGVPHLDAHGTAIVSEGMGIWVGLLGTTLHAASYLLVTAVLASVVYERLGVGLLRRAWINLDVIWASALIVTGVFTLFV